MILKRLYIYLFFLVCFTIIINSCKTNCNFPVNIQAGFIDKNTNIKLLVGNDKFEKTFDYFVQPDLQKKIIYENYCNDKFEFDIKIVANLKRDTSISIDSKIISRVFIGFEKNYFNIKYIYRDHRKANDSIEFEDW